MKKTIYVVAVCGLLVFLVLFLLPFSTHYLSLGRIRFIIAALGLLILAMAYAAVRNHFLWRISYERFKEESASQKIISEKNRDLEKTQDCITDVRDKLMVSEEKYKTILENIADGYFETDIQGNILFFNPSFCRLVNLSPESLYNTQSFDFLPENSRQTLKDAFMGLYHKREKEQRVEHNFFSNDGELHVHELSVSLMKDANGNPTGFRGVVRDVTERHSSSLAVRQSEDRLKSILNSINAGIVLIDPENHTIVEANPAALKLIGGSRKEVLESVCHRFICPAEKGECPITDLGKQMENAERKLINMDGQEIDILKSVLEIRYNGRPHLLESFIDISQLKRIQKELRASMDAAEKANRTKSEFLANMSHELRTPLNHVIGFSELLMDPNFGELNETQAEYMADIHNSSRHLLSLINDILDLSKVEAGKMELDMSQVPIKKLLESSLFMVKEKTISHGMALTLTTHQLPEVIQADERKLKQIMYNLLSNSIKFTPDNGKIEIHAVLEKNGNAEAENQPQIIISIKDSGMGIAQENIHRIFENFEQVENPSTKKYQGTGIGLTLTRKLVALHGGKIWAESEGQGHGSTFTFTIPVRYDHPEGYRPA